MTECGPKTASPYEHPMLWFSATSLATGKMVGQQYIFAKNDQIVAIHIHGLVARNTTRIDGPNCHKEPPRMGPNPV